MEDSSQDRNLPATGRKLQKAREEGQIARSRDLTHFAVLGVGSCIFALAAPGIAEVLKRMLSQQLTFDASVVAGVTNPIARASAAVESGLHAYLPLGFAMAVVAILASLASGGWVMTLKPLMPDPGRIDPFQGLGRLFSVQQLLETAKLVFLILVLSLLAWRYLEMRMGDLAGLLQQALTTGLSAMGSVLFAGTLVLSGVLLAAAAVDVPLQSYLHGRRMRMSLQEVKQEHKESDGNPQMKGRQRARQRELAQRSSVSAVPGADLVVMNPTHYAVALRYDESTMRAPRVIAKGADLVALRIRDVAASSSVPVLQAPMLARALYANAEIDQEVPAALYTAVAQVLAYVYQLKAAMRGEATAPARFVAPQVPAELDPHAKRQTEDPHAA